MVLGDVAASNTKRKQAPRKKLAALSAVFRTIAGFRKVSIRVLEQLIFVPVT